MLKSAEMSWDRRYVLWNRPLWPVCVNGNQVERMPNKAKLTGKVQQEEAAARSRSEQSPSFSGGTRIFGDHSVLEGNFKRLLGFLDHAIVFGALQAEHGENLVVHAQAVIIGRDDIGGDRIDQAAGNIHGAVGH